MNIRQAAEFLTGLGFTMNPMGADCPTWGRKPAEVFATPHHILSTPFRDVFIGKVRSGWYVTSNIKFKARRKRARLYNTFDHHMANIFGSGDTLLKAMINFETNFKLQMALANMKA
jgi:hypothetical protein